MQLLILIFCLTANLGSTFKVGSAWMKMFEEPEEWNGWGLIAGCSVERSPFGLSLDYVTRTIIYYGYTPVGLVPPPRVYEKIKERSDALILHVAFIHEIPIERWRFIFGFGLGRQLTMASLKGVETGYRVEDEKLATSFHILGRVERSVASRFAPFFEMKVICKESSNIYVTDVYNAPTGPALFLCFYGGLAFRIM